jgi:hypothetical protein
VPVAAAAGVILRFLVQEYRSSSLYARLPEGQLIVLQEPAKISDDR